MIPAFTRPPARRSPIDGWFATHAERWTTIGAYAIPSAFKESVPTGSNLTLVDRSLRDRFGCKGPEAEAWLRSIGCAPAEGANRWHLLPSGVLAARLATSEFLIERLVGNSADVGEAQRRLASPTREPGVYTVVRQDFVVDLSGPRLIECLRQICNVDFGPVIAASNRSGGPVILTSIIGVSTVAIARVEGESPAVTLWIDPSFAHYYWTTLLDVATALSGGVGVATNDHEPGEGA